jgi:hypothetical protein
MLSADDQEYVRNAVEHSRDASVCEDSVEVRYALERLEKAAAIITDAMFRPTGLAADPSPTSDDDVAKLSDVS